MRILFCGLPAYGHLYPLLPLAVACRDAGHDVEFATGAEFELQLRRAGFVTHAVGMTVDEGQEAALASDPTLADLPPDEKWRFGAVFFGSVLARDKSRGLVPIIDRVAPDLVVYEEYDLGSAIAAAVTGTAAMGHALGCQLPDRFRIPFTERLRAMAIEEWPATEWVDPFAGNALLDIAPPRLRDPNVAAPAERIALRPVAWAEPASGLPAWVNRPRPRPLAYVTLGTVVYGAVESLRAAVDGLSALDVDVLVTVGPKGDPAAIGPVPDRVHVERFVPQDQLLPHVDVLVHHCGSGTMLGGLAQGLPQLALPHGADQFNNAAMLAGSGAGLRLHPDEITPAAITERAQALLTDPRYRRASRDLATEIATMPAPAAVVPTLLRTSGRARREHSA